MPLLFVAATRCPTGRYYVLEQIVAFSLALVSTCALPVVPPSVAGSLVAPVEERRDSHANGEGFALTSDMPPPPDYDRVMEEEYDAAVREGTNSALIRFIARHPDHPLADRARSLLSGRDKPDKGVSPTDPDADVYAAFDRARRENTVAAFRNFIALHPHHPLTAEARRQMTRLRALPESRQ